MNKARDEAAPIIAAMKGGIPVAKVRTGDYCPKIPTEVTSMMLLIDDRRGQGPLAFDGEALLDQVDSVIFDAVWDVAIFNSPQLLADKARTGGRVLLVQSTNEGIAAWKAAVIVRPKLAANSYGGGIEHEKKKLN